MKAAAFEHVRPATLTDAIALLAQDDGARALAGGQSLGPMLNLRLAQPRLLVQLNHLPELAGANATADAVTIGAAVTHAAIADGRVADIGGGVLAAVAERIAYRAVRNRGTIGGSLCHADPAADWAVVLTALDATVLLHGPNGARAVVMHEFIRGAFHTALRPGEVLRAVRVPVLSPDARFAYEKACRKPGDFAHAMTAVLRQGRHQRVVLGALGGRPLLLQEGDAPLDAAAQALDRMERLDPVQRHMHIAVLRRAWAKANA